ncbi:hypothetical protein LOY34_13970 [Pseudomonas sp. B21-009]|uniref:hypothetical protein n=1 Tax=Pseudomonas sp. B21-009 TaxID=2895470 RepID=UPI00215F1B72|nr:hypothetical protein [Pseudomonas sp. B21-009]UVM64459.1 hypothetical protein LOY34_13970 [Pseudomonas sp. B21-009]
MPTENQSSNTYRHTFAATCPGDGEVIVYSLQIRSQTMIRVEHIKTATALIKQGWHEQIADQLAEHFGGDQVIKAVHQGVEIETVRLSG